MGSSLRWAAVAARSKAMGSAGSYGSRSMATCTCLVLLPWWVWTWTAVNFTFGVRSHSPSACPYPRSLSPIFRSYLSRPLTNLPSHSPLPIRSMSSLTVGPLSFTKGGWLSATQSLFTGRISSSTVFQGHCSGPCSIITVYFWLVHTYWADPPINKAWLFFFFSSSSSRREGAPQAAVGDLRERR